MSEVITDGGGNRYPRHGHPPGQSSESQFPLKVLTWTPEGAESSREQQGLCGGTGLGPRLFLGIFHSLSKGEFGNTFHSAHFAGRGQWSLSALIAAQRGVHKAELVSTLSSNCWGVEDRAGSEGTVPKWLPKAADGRAWALVLTSFSEAPAKSLLL